MTAPVLQARADAAEVALKRARLVAFARERERAVVVLRRHDTLGWLLGGADVLVSRQGAPIAEAVVHEGGVTVVTNRIEAERLRHEELPSGVAVESVPWEVDGAVSARALELAQAVAGPEGVLDDTVADLTTLRWPLLPAEIERYRAAGTATARAMTDVAPGLSAAMSEHEAAARMTAALRSLGMHVPVVLVAGASRLGTVRHPVPTHAPLGAAALIVVCSEARGLVSAASRLVRFGPEPGPVSERLDAVLEVERAMLDATVGGARTADVFQAAQRAYAQVGHPDAWRDHHQGGPIGYRPREWLATPTDSRPVVIGAAFAWNPSLPWAKTEDTFLLAQDGLENLTWDPRWPTRRVGDRDRADVLVL